MNAPRLLAKRGPGSLAKAGNAVISANDATRTNARKDLAAANNTSTMIGHAAVEVVIDCLLIPHARQFPVRKIDARAPEEHLRAAAILKTPC